MRYVDKVKILQYLHDACSNDVEFAKFVNDPVDAICPNLCSRLIPAIVENELLKNDLQEVCF